MNMQADTTAAEDIEEIVYAATDAADDGRLRVDARRLLKGMFVAELDRPWSDTPLPRSGLSIETDEELQAIRSHCQFVMVDPARSPEELVAAIRAAAKLSGDRMLSGEDELWDKRSTGRDGDATPAKARRRTAASGAAPRPRDDVRPSEASRARVLRLVREGEQAPSSERGPLSQVRRWLGLGRRSPSEDAPDTEVARHQQALQALCGQWGDAIGACGYDAGAPIRDSLPLARPVHARMVTVADMAIRQVRQATALAFEPLAEAADGFAASLAAAPDAMRWLDAVHADNAPTPNPALGVALRLGEFGRALGMAHDSLRELVLIGLLADVGKALLPRELLDHPGVLKPSDYALVQQHVTIGLDILSRSGSVPEPVLRGIAEHHERLDGTGYPHALRGDAIGLYGRMAAIVDTFCALTAARAYANPLSAESALSALDDWSGPLFCRRLVEQFILVNGAFPVGSLVELQSGEVAAVVERQPGSRLQPKLVVMTGPDKGPARPRRDAPPADRGPVGRRSPVRIARGLPAGSFGLRLRDYYATPT
jgi:HD-GYP domain-containing protein (c-di-GMP phosphodiesterase class II)